MSRGRFLLDCDPGIDDAFAILCALQFGQVDAITTVSGNVSVDNTTRNAQYVLDLAGRDVPVFRGAEAPLVIEAINADYIHGISGLGEHQVPEPKKPAQAIGAVDKILDYCSAGDATIIAIGPLTNIALAIRQDPTVTDRIDHLYWMGGGSTFGNVTPLAEFNAWCDPHGAAEVLDSNVVMTVFDLNLTHTVLMGPTELGRLASIGTALSSVLAEALEFYTKSTPDGLIGRPMHDPCAILGFLRPDLFEFAPSHIVCETTDLQRGRTIVDFAAEHPPHRIAVSADSDAIIQHIFTAVESLGADS